MRAYRTLSPELIYQLDDLCFPADDDYPFEGAVWWVYKDVHGRSAGYCGVKLLDGPNKGTAFLCRAGVLPAYAGQGLQRKMLRIRENYAYKHGCDTVLTYTVQNNYPSIVNLIKAGYRFYEPSHAWEGRDVFYFIKYL